MNVVSTKPTNKHRDYYQKRIRTGFLIGYSDERWIGGINYIRNLLKAIISNQNRQIDPVLFVGYATPDDLIPNVQGLEIIRSHLFDKYRPSWVLRKTLKKLLSRDYLLEKMLFDKGIQVLSHSGWLGRGSNLPCVSWIPDFQHLHLPQYFSDEELALRNSTIQETCKYSSCIILSSRSVERDLIDFSKNEKIHTEVLHFVSDVSEPDILDRDSFVTRYGLNGPFFHMPAQFWAHKNHQLIIDALKILKERGQEVTVVATGSQVDDRNPEYFASLMQQVKAFGLGKSFITPGVVPYEDVIGLMYHSKAVINPSLFEGWSTVVEECKSLSKTVLLSDIDVHREQAPRKGYYFDLDDAEALAVLMWQIWTSDGPAHDNWNKINQDFEHRWHRFAQRYEDIILTVNKSVS